MNLTKLLNDVNIETNEMFIMNPKLKTFDWKYRLFLFWFKSVYITNVMITLSVVLSILSMIFAKQIVTNLEPSNYENLRYPALILAIVVVLILHLANTKNITKLTFIPTGVIGLVFSLVLLIRIPNYVFVFYLYGAIIITMMTFVYTMLNSVFELIKGTFEVIREAFKQKPVE